MRSDQLSYPPGAMPIISKFHLLFTVIANPKGDWEPSPLGEAISLK